MGREISIFNSQRIIIKIGSSLLIDNEKFNYRWLESFIADVIMLKKRKIEVLIVASGAVSLGKNYLGIKDEKISITDKQALAACGQVILMNNFIKAFEKSGIKVAQILLTYSDTEDRRKSLNSRETLKNLLSKKVIPVINENDSVATDELKFGDNDRLASRVAQIIGADLLVLLSDVDGLYDKNPKSSEEARLIPVVENINERSFNFISKETNFYGSGGMLTKIQAAEIADAFGCNTLICRGNVSNPIKNFERKKIGTLFFSNNIKKRGFKNWIAGTINVAGNVTIDDGALEALEKGASLLPIGVKKISGNFQKGDIIQIFDSVGKKIGKGITYYDYNEIKLIKGKQTKLIKTILGYEGREELIHRDYLFLNSKT